MTAAIIAAGTWVNATLPVFAINLILGTRDELWALRSPETHDLLWIDERHEPPREHRDRHHRLRLGVDVPAPGIAVASEAVTNDPGWTALQPGELLHIGPDLEPQVILALPDPPAHQLTLADLDPRAVAAMHEK